MTLVNPVSKRNTAVVTLFNGILPIWLNVVTHSIEVELLLSKIFQTK